MSKQLRIGVFGGTFNPIHMGHLVIADAVRDEYKLDTILFVPAYKPPHKRSGVLDGVHRYAMTELAIADNPHFQICDIEMKREGYSYSVDTIKALKEMYPEGTTFYFIAGTDTIHQLPEWKYIYELLELCEFVGATRPDGTEVIDSVIEYFGALGKAKIHRLQTPELQISSTDLRQRIAEGRTVRYMIPDAVIEYIHTHHIYEREAEHSEV